MNTIKTLAVFCGSSEGRDGIYAQGAQELGKAMHEKQLSLVYGGGNRGLMGLLAESLHTLGGSVIGVLPEALNRGDVRLRKVESQLIIVPGMHERKARMYELADAFVALPGGIGTFEEFFEVYTWLQLGYHHKPVALLNLGGFYDSLLSFLHQSAREGFIQSELLSALIVESEVEALLARLENWEAKLPDKLGPHQ
jgi:uncharacterized protein (TIGR00730 family)